MLITKGASVMADKIALIVFCILTFLIVTSFLVLAHFVLYYVDYPPFMWLRLITDNDYLKELAYALTWFIVFTPFIVIWLGTAALFKGSASNPTTGQLLAILAGFMVVAVVAAHFAIRTGVRPDGAEIIEYGIYEVERTGETDEADLGPAPLVQYLKAYSLVEQTDRVPNTPGTSFGIEFVVTAIFEVGEADISVRNLHPPIRGLTQTQWTQRGIVGEKDFGGYTLDHDSARVQGTWTFQVISEGEVLAEKSFEVIDTQ